MNNTEKLVTALLDGLRPAEQLDLAEWSERNIVLSPEDSAARGKFTAWPFQIEPMSVMSPRHECEKVCILAASQTLKTRLMLNFLGFVIAADPGPVLFVEPRAQDAEALSKDRVTPMLRDTPALRGKVVDAKSRESGNTIEHKKFAGGHVSFAIATSPSSLAMRPIRYLFLDEISRGEYRTSNEGDPVRLAERRTVTFWNRKIIYASSPGNEGECRISDVFRYSDQRQWHVPCPHCGHYQVLEWSGMVWSSKGQPITWHENGKEHSGVISADAPRYRCSGCDNLIEERHKSEMNERGKYIAQNPDGKYPGFRINALVSPVVRWANIVQEWIENQGKPEQLKTFVNTVLAETWKEIGEAPDWEKLYARREQYQIGKIPEGVLFLTAGVDIQADRGEVSLYGWGRNRECWLVDHQVLLGKPSERSLWNALTEYRQRMWEHPGGYQIGILRMAVDTGYETNEVYQWVRQQSDPSVFAIKGRDALGGPVLGQPNAVDVTLNGRPLKRGLKLWPVDVSKLKHELYGRLNLPRPVEGESFPSGWIHLPEIDEEACKQLVAEQIFTTTKKGYKRTEWQKIRPRNERMDCWVYARAAAHQAGIDRFTEREWRRFESYSAQKATAPAVKPIVPDTEFTPPPPVPPMPQPHRASSWLSGGRSSGSGWLDR